MSKYLGDPNKITYRSLWERQTFKWADENPGITGWSSEEVIIPYRCKTDKKIHRYFMDLKLVTDKGTYLIEIKPRKQTLPPKEPKRKTKRYLNEVMGYIKNTCKWSAAEAYALDHGWTFEIWTEETLKSLGIKLVLKG